MYETIEQKKRRLFGKQYLSDYLSVIEKITHCKKENIRLLPIVETDKIIEKESSLKLVYSTKMMFDDKTELKRIIAEKIESEDGFYLFTSLSRDCGVVVIDSLEDFNFDFNFMDDHSGIVSLVSSNLKEKILLDFYEEEGEKFIEVEYYL